MIGTIDVNIQAARPDFPLTPLKAFLNSPSSIRVRNVPKKIGKWEVTSVTISANYPDNTTKSAACVLTAGIWVGTLAGCAAVGTSGLGYSVIASGTDENGAAVSGYVLGKGEVEIMPTDGTIVIGETAYYIHLLDAVPTNPHKGDLVKVDGTWKFWNGTAWEVFGGGGGGGIEEYANREAFPATGVSGVLYCAKDTDKLYRWATELSPVTYAEVSPSADVSGKADKVANATSGNFAGLDANGNLTDSGKKAADFDAAGAAATAKSEAIAACDPAGSASAAQTAAIAACVKKQGESSQSVEGQLSVGALYVGGTKVEVVSAVPASPIADTLYFVTGS